MPKVFADFQQGVDARTQDKALKLDGAARDQCIREALTGRYSKARALDKIADFTGDGATFKWAINTTNFPGWVEEFSVITEAEYPADDTTTQRTPNTLEPDEWFIYRLSSSVRELRLTTATPATGKKLRVSYTALHAEDGSDVPDGDFEGVVNLAAHLACQRISALYSQQGDSAIGADAVDYKQKATSFADLARVYEERFKEIFGLDKDEQQPAASQTREWPVRLQEGSDRLIH